MLPAFEPQAVRKLLAACQTPREHAILVSLDTASGRPSSPGWGCKTPTFRRGPSGSGLVKAEKIVSPLLVTPVGNEHGRPSQDHGAL